MPDGFPLSDSTASRSRDEVVVTMIFPSVSYTAHRKFCRRRTTGRTRRARSGRRRRSRRGRGGSRDSLRLEAPLQGLEPCSSGPRPDVLPCTPPDNLPAPEASSCSEGRYIRPSRERRLLTSRWVMVPTSRGTRPCAVLTATRLSRSVSMTRPCCWRRGHLRPVDGGVEDGKLQQRARVRGTRPGRSHHRRSRPDR